MDYVACIEMLIIKIKWLRQDSIIAFCIKQFSKHIQIPSSPAHWTQKMSVITNLTSQCKADHTTSTQQASSPFCISHRLFKFEAACPNSLTDHKEFHRRRLVCDDISSNIFDTAQTSARDISTSGHKNTRKEMVTSKHWQSWIWSYMRITSISRISVQWCRPNRVSNFKPNWNINT